MRTVLLALDSFRASVHVAYASVLAQEFFFLSANN